MAGAVTRNDELKLVVELACLTEARSDDEQRALVAVAWRCDQEHNRDTVTNRARRDPEFKLWDVTSYAVSSRELDPGNGDHRITEPAGWSRAWARWAPA
jgi:hypothetical protein